MERVAFNVKGLKVISDSGLVTAAAGSVLTFFANTREVRNPKVEIRSPKPEGRTKKNAKMQD